MSDPGPQPAAPPPRPLFQFTLRTLLLLFVVLGSSLGVFGAWGIVNFVLSWGLRLPFIRLNRCPPPGGALVRLICLSALSGPAAPGSQACPRRNRKGVQSCEPAAQQSRVGASIAQLHGHINAGIGRR